MSENLTDRLDTAFKQIKGEGRITELNIAATLKEIRRALVDADVNYKIAKDFTDTVKEKAMGEKVINAVSPGQLMVKIVKDELVNLMGGSEVEFVTKGNPAVILIAGLQGSGKTTFSAKLVNYLKTKNKNIGIIDTAGRLAVDEGMMKEVADIKAAVNPTEMLFVVDSMTGQD